ncbi:MAG: helix-turn-helix domain-containing protein [Burkholderiaceae bacterium]
MDRSDLESDDSNIDGEALRMSPAPVPTYALYGERPRSALAEAFHCESIASRSRLHDWRIKPHRHEAFFQILYIRGGRGEAVFDARRLAFAPPCVITVPARAAHGFAFSPDVDGVVLTVVDRQLEAMLGAAPDLLPSLAQPRLHRLVADSAQRARFDQWFASFADEFAGDAPWRALSLQTTLVRLLIELARGLADVERAQPGPAYRKQRHLRRFGALVDRDYRRRRPIADYASELGITATQLNRICRELRGCSALGVLNARILLEAERDLLYTTQGVKEVALGLGFADAGYFTRFFARHTGRTPSAFRDHARQQLAARRRS